MSDAFLDRASARPVPLVPLTEEDLPGWRARAREPDRRWVEASGFEAASDSICLVPDRDGGLAAVLAGVRDPGDPFALGGLPGALPAGEYALDSDWPAPVRERAALGWALGAYRFTRYRDEPPPGARLVLPEDCDANRVRALARAVTLARDLINTPASDMMPEHLARALRTLASEHGAAFEETVGDDLLAHGYPAVHTVGRASASHPRLLDLRWGEASHPRLTLIGKGVCFDSGGLDLKTATGMRLMKKDMGGAAHAAALAHLVMALDLPVRLRVLVPAVENAVSAGAYRPGDVLDTRAGLTVEIHNTDAEGRLVLCDALAAAGEESPDLVVDFATLTGAARVAVGAEIAAMFCNDDAVAGGIEEAAGDERDPVWRLPLHRAYRDLIDSKVANLANAASVPYAGAITAALFLESFVPEGTRWAHFDVMGWNARARPGRPEGGEAMGVRAMWAYLEKRYGARG